MWLSEVWKYVRGDWKGKAQENFKTEIIPYGTVAMETWHCAFVRIHISLYCMQIKCQLGGRGIPEWNVGVTNEST